QEAEGKGVVFNCASLEAMLENPEIDVIAVGGAYGDRGDVVKRALAAGKHVLSDKPFCISLEELEQISALIAEHKSVLGCMFDLRTAPNFHTAAKLLADGIIGRLSSIQFNGMHPLNYGVRPGWYFEAGMHGGTINDIAIHLFDLLPGMTGSSVRRILAARSGNLNFSQVPGFSNTGALMLELTNGVCVTGDVSYFAPSFDSPAYWRFTISGTEGMLEFNYNTPGVLHVTRDGSRMIPPESAPADYFDAFLQELAGNPASPCTNEILQTARWALTAQQIADANQ
ncbi:MAG: Gfo/Idh/MocA family oxidoreductase, partial [Victivallales bacterium]|nr:Gfo/Idh/MocA family oxidoreductase [Victivallales bacterium]